MENNNFFFGVTRHFGKLDRISKQWFEPHATSRDAAFRERVIRSTLPFLLGLTLLSFVATFVVYKNEWGLISFPSLHIVVIIGLLISSFIIYHGHISISATVFIVTIILGASGIVLIARQQGNLATIVTSGIPSFMLAPLLATLLLPRSLVIPCGFLTIIMYSLSQFGLVVGDSTIEGFNFEEAVFAVFLIIAIESILLRHLRIEFDARFAAIQQSLEQTELAREEAEIARQRAEAADNAKSQFLANMSHELRTPLNAIIGYSEAMTGGMAGEFSDQQLTLLGHIRHNGRRLLDLINDILDLSKIESGHLDVVLAPMSVRPTIQQTVESLRSLAVEKNIKLEVEFTDEVPGVILCDLKKFDQILVNLLSNAIKFTLEGSVVIAASRVDNQNWQLSVSDTGIGMPPDAAGYIFEPFRQVDGTSTRKHKGTGLGLAITKQLIDSLNGTIVVESELGKGTTFTITLPIAPTPQSAEAQNAGNQNDAGTQAN